MKPHVARKRFGQHFLRDNHIIEKIINSITATKENIIVEIGPGQGALSKPLLKKYQQLELIEIDRLLIKQLHAEFKQYRHLIIHECDVLKFDFSRYGRHKAYVVGNLPYNISTPIIFRLIESLPHIEQMLFMLQKEVVERICSASGEKSYGRLSVMIQAQCQVKKLFDVKPGAFSPPPKVVSSIVRITPLQARKDMISNQLLFKTIVRAAFNQRRKKISNSLEKHVSKEQLQSLSIPHSCRAEELTVSDYINISNRIDTDKQPLNHRQ